MAVAIYPGSFDPITLGHLDIIERASAIFDRLVVAVSGESRHKKFTFSDDERCSFIRRCTRGLPNVTVEIFHGLVTGYAMQKGANVLVRGLRAVSDYEYELKMASMNRRLAPDVETIFMMTQTRFSFVSSSTVKEIGYYGGDISTLVPPEILDDITSGLKKES